MTHIGEFVYGDTGTDLVVSLKKPDGTAVNIDGASSISLEGQEVGGLTRISVAATILGDPSLGQLSIENIGNAYQPPLSRPRATFECRLKWTASTEQFWSRSAFRLDLVRFP
jgi:hypothetical protein